MKTRVVLALGALLASGLAASAADAAVKKPKPAPPVCQLVKDDAGDAKALQADDKLDIVTADVASDASTVTAVIRMKGAPGGTDTAAPFGRGVYFIFTPTGAAEPVFLSVGFDPAGGATYKYGSIVKGTTTNYTTKGDATGSIVGNEIHISVPTAALGALGNVKAGSKLNGLTVESKYYIGVAPNPTGVYAASLQPADDATGKSYIAGAKSCVTPGK